MCIDIKPYNCVRKYNYKKTLVTIKHKIMHHLEDRNIWNHITVQSVLVLIRFKNSYRKLYFFFQMIIIRYFKSNNCLQQKTNFGSPNDWSCRIHRQRLCRGIRPPPQGVSWYDTKSDGEAGALGYAEYYNFSVSPWATLVQSGSTG